MAFLISIIKNLEQKYAVTVKGSYFRNQRINGILFLDENDINFSYLYPETLYLADFSQANSKDLVGNILYINCNSDISKEGILYISEKLNLYDLHNTIEFSIQEYLKVENNKNLLFNALYSGKSLIEILETAYKIIKSPIVVCDSSYSIISSFPDVSNDSHLELNNNRLSVKSIFTDNMKKSQTIDKIYHSVYPFVTKMEHLDYPVVFESIRIKKAVVGYMFIRCLDNEHDENYLDFIHSLTQMVSIYLQKDETYSNSIGFKYDMFLKDLFTRQFDNEELALKHLGYMGVKSKKYFFVIVSSFTNGYEKIMANQHYSTQLSTILKNSITGVIGSRFISLVSVSDKENFLENLSTRLETFLTLNHMLAAVSYSFKQLYDAPLYVKQAQSLLSDKLVSYNESAVLFYTDYYLKHVVGMSRRQAAVKATINPAIADILEYDKLEKSEYFYTLKVYFENNRNMPATAKALFIHKSTLFYRFDKMKQLFNIDIYNPDKLFSYEYSIRILNLL